VIIIGEALARFAFFRDPSVGRCQRGRELGLPTWMVQEETAEISTKRLQLLKVAVPEAVFDRMTPERPDALFAVNNALNLSHRQLVAELALKNRLPTMAAFREITEAGGFMSYGSARTDLFRRAAGFVGKILKGTKPADLPVEQPTRYQLVINMQTARLLGIEVPAMLLAVADEVIE
jgi:putative ABC transport system substrate-binding protein